MVLCESAGACCYDDGGPTCVNVSESVCIELEGVWAEGVTCGELEGCCGDTDPGVCCIANVCQEGHNCMTCAAAGGVWVSGPADCDTCNMANCCD